MALTFLKVTNPPPVSLWITMVYKPCCMLWICFLRYDAAGSHLCRCRMMYLSVALLAGGKRLSSSRSFSTKTSTSGSVSDPRSTSSGLFTPSPASEASEFRLSLASPIRALYIRKGMMGSGSWGGHRGDDCDVCSQEHLPVSADSPVWGRASARCWCRVETPERAPPALYRSRTPGTTSPHASSLHSHDRFPGDRQRKALTL